jgi:hypothetical protein
MIVHVLKNMACIGLGFSLMAGSVSANPIEKVAKADSSQIVVEEKEPRTHYDLTIGFLAPYSTIGSDYNGSAYERIVEYKVILPRIDGKMGWGGSIGCRIRTSGQWTATIEMIYYKATHDYTWQDSTGKATIDAASLELSAIYPRFALQPLLFIGGSLLGVKVDNGAEDGQSNMHDAEHFGVDLKFGCGLNLELSKNLWLSSRIGYRRYWLHSVKIAGDIHDFDPTQKENGLWLTIGLYGGIRIK